MSAFSFQKRFFLLFILIHFCVWVWQVSQRHVYTLDSYEYLYSAENLKETGIPYNGDFSEAINPDLYTRRPPFYGIFLLLTTFFTLNIPVILIAQIGISLSAFYFFNQKWIKKNLTELEQKIFYVTLGLTPSWFFYSGFIMSEIVLLAILVFMVLLFNEFQNKDSLKMLFKQSTMLTLAYLTKPVFYLFWPVYSFFIFIQSTKKVKSIILFVGLSLIGVLSISFYNYQFTGNFQYSSMQRIGFVNFNAFHFQMQELGYDAAHAWLDSVDAKAKLNHPDNYAAYSTELMSASVRFCMDRPVKYGLYYAKGILVFFLDPGRFDLYNFFGLDKIGQSGLMDVIRVKGFSGILEYFKTQPIFLFLVIGIVLFVNGLKLIGYIFYLFKFKSFTLTEWFMFSIIVYVALLTGPNGASRYALPIQFFLIYGSSKGWGTLIHYYKKR